MDKVKLQERLIELEKEFLRQAEGTYDDYVSESQWADKEVVDDDVASHKSENAEISEELEHQVEDHAEHLKILEGLDFSPADEVRPGAVVKLNDRYMVVAVARSKFTFQGKDFIGISPEAPIYQSMHGKKAGEEFQFNGKKFKIKAVY